MCFGNIIVILLSNEFFHNSKPIIAMKSYEIKSILTKFFYRNEHLYFQIMIQSEDSLEIHGEYTNYSEYKENFDVLQNDLVEKNQFKVIPEKFVVSKIPLAKVA